MAKDNVENNRNSTNVYLDSYEPEIKPEEGKNTQYIATLIATFSAFAMGLCLSWSSSAIPMLQESSSTIQITDQQGSWIGSLLTLGALVGAIPAGYVAQRLTGPKRLLQLLAFPLFGSWIVIAYCGTVYGLYVARFMSGVAIGAISVAAPMYVGELAEPKIRGTLGTFFQLQITLGLLCEYILGGSVKDFQILALISSIVPVVFLFCFTFMPESPVFLTARGNHEQAKASLQWFRSDSHNIDSELSAIKENLQASKDSGDNFRILSDIPSRRALVISLMLMVFQQLSGINAVFFYAQKIFADSGSGAASGQQEMLDDSSMSPSTCAILLGLVQVIATYAATLLIDRAGRRILLLISASVMSLCLAVMAVFFHLKTTGVDMTAYANVPIITLATFIIVFSFGFGPVPWLMMTELFSPAVKGSATSISAACNWLLAFVVTKFFQDMLDCVGPAVTFAGFSVTCAFATVFVFSRVPETKGKDVDTIIRMLSTDTDKAAAGNPASTSTPCRNGLEGMEIEKKA